MKKNRGSKRGWWIGFFALLFLGVLPEVHASMEDDVMDVTLPEAWGAIRQTALEFKGIDKEKPEQGWVETQWVEDKVRRSRGMFRHILYQQYERRSKLRFSLVEIPNGVHLKVKGLFQDRAPGLGGNVPWKTVRMDPSDHRLERENFFKVLSTLQTNRRKVLSANPLPPAIPVPVKVTSRQT